MFGLCFTVCNWTPAVVETLRSSVGKAGITYMQFAYERCPTTGTPHLQGYMQVKKKDFYPILKATGLKVVKEQRMTADHNYNYCGGGENGDKPLVEGIERYGCYDCSVKGTVEKHQGKRNDVSGMKGMVDDGCTLDEIWEVYGENCMKYYKFLQDRIQLNQERRAREARALKYNEVVLRPWQMDVVRLIEDPPDDRKIHWYVDEVGCKGKSWLAQFLQAKHKCVILKPGPVSGMAHLLTKFQDYRAIIMDIPRGKVDNMDYLYAFLEELKDGVQTSYKYDSRQLMIPDVHVLVFANDYPDRSQWSRDRLVEHVL